MSVPKQRLSVDWRDHSRSRHDLIDRATSFLIRVDGLRSAVVEVPDSKAKGAIEVVEEDGITKVVRNIVGQNRKATLTSRSIDFWCKLAAVLCEIIAMWQNKAGVYRRQLLYMVRDNPNRYYAVRAAIKPGQLNTILGTIALTLGFHPTLLGVLSQPHAELIIAKGIKIKIEQATDIFEFLESGDTDTATLPHTRIDVPDRIYSLKVSSTRGVEIYAVIVVEYRNIMTTMSWNVENLAGVILIMMGGNASHAAREFLNLLSKDPRLARVPFWYFGDCDMSGIVMFFVLKYGAQSSAWASGSLVCPKLQWGGPSEGDALHTIDELREIERASLRQKHRRDTEEQLDRRVASWAKGMRHYLRSHMSGPKSNDKSCWAGIKKLGLHELEAGAAAAAEAVLGGRGFSMAALQHFGTSNLEAFIFSRAKNFVRVPQANPLANRSTQERRLDLESQRAEEEELRQEMEEQNRRVRDNAQLRLSVLRSLRRNM